MVLTGANGAGKTNLIEAISFPRPAAACAARRSTRWRFPKATAPGRCRPRSRARSASPRSAPASRRTDEEATLARKCRIDREPVPSAAAFADHLRIVWLTPQMDQLFAGPASERRRFLDRLVLAVDPQHMGRVNALERALRSRNRLLEEPRPDPHWLDAIEHETAEVAVAVAAARAETVRRLQGALDGRKDTDSPFPGPRSRSTAGWRRCCSSSPRPRSRTAIRNELREGRARDAAAGRTLAGPHLTDLDVMHGPKAIAAADASTGEQKALLIGLVLAHAGLITEMTGFAPLLLLDEVVAHLDPMRRAALYDALARLGAQVWMTGADPAVFLDIAARAQVFEVTPGHVTRRM